jgi:23S rRNA pseudouridine2604 synthase
MIPSSTAIRLNKYLADRGLASRREADALITAGKVTVNDKVATLGQKVTAADEVKVTGTSPKTYLCYYKGRGIITHSPAAGEVDIVTRLKSDHGITGVSPIGRLDKDSEGLLILSDDGRLTKHLLDPDAHVEKEYEVTVDKPVTAFFLKAMAAGVDIEGYRTKRALVRAHPRNQKTFTIILTEGKKHQIRRMCAALGYQVQTLRRVRVGVILLGNLKPNQYRKIVGKELQNLLQLLHPVTN